MNALNVMTVARNRWFQKGAVALGAILVGSAATLSLLVPIRVNMPASQHEPASALSAARQRYEDFKLAEVEQRTLPPLSTSALSAARQRYENFKLAQAEAVSTPAPRGNAQLRAAFDRYETFKLRQSADM
jgi:hypothetical protein